jgi:hypothetical protein
VNTSIGAGQLGNSSARDCDPTYRVRRSVLAPFIGRDGLDSPGPGGWGGRGDPADPHTAAQGTG